MIAAHPGDARPTQRIVAELAAGRRTQAVWRNEIGGVTFELGEGEAREFLKWTPHGNGVDLGEEIRRLQWAGRYIAVPRVLKQGADEEGSWFVSAGLPGSTAVDERWKRQPATAVRAIGEGLRALHDALPVADCPFSWSAQDRVARANQAAADGRRDPRDWHDIHQPLGVERALALINDIPPADKLVVCHGDPCSPNTLIGEHGRGPRTWTSTSSAWRTAGPIWPSRPGPPSGTTARVGPSRSSRPTASSPTGTASRTTKLLWDLCD
jgi:aminoglycoside phosphotransferase